ncbi:OmpA family protein [Burkholderia metallica]|uniref:OmpA family protein n=1 Tax=Burkholderia metallica TaxID=488729 RepID=UPI000A057B26|nr:OmpA family protein [Burkholderia metallica]
MKILIALSLSIFSVLSFFTTDASAECQGPQNLPSQQFFVAFPPNSPDLTQSEKLRIEQWVSEVNTRHPRQNWVDIIGSASRNETTPDRLATKRAAAVAKAVIDDGLINAPFQIKTQIYPASSTTESTSETREVTVQVSPGCLNDCCTGR